MHNTHAYVHTRASFSLSFSVYRVPSPSPSISLLSRLTRSPLHLSRARSRHVGVTSLIRSNRPLLSADLVNNLLSLPLITAAPRGRSNARARERKRAIEPPPPSLSLLPPPSSLVPPRGSLDAFLTISRSNCPRRY